jgi:hypothetical protein
MTRGLALGLVSCAEFNMYLPAHHKNPPHSRARIEFQDGIRDVLTHQAKAGIREEVFSWSR